METHYVFFEVEIEFLDVIYINLVLYGVKPSIFSRQYLTLGVYNVSECRILQNSTTYL
jgi:hypothetical protein